MQPDKRQRPLQYHLKTILLVVAGLACVFAAARWLAQRVDPNTGPDELIVRSIIFTVVITMVIGVALAIGYGIVGQRKAMAWAELSRRDVAAAQDTAEKGLKALEDIAAKQEETNRLLQQILDQYCVKPESDHADSAKGSA